METGFNSTGHQGNIEVAVTAAEPTRDEKITAARVFLNRVKGHMDTSKAASQAARGTAETGEFKRNPDADPLPALENIEVLRRQTNHTLNDKR